MKNKYISIKYFFLILIISVQINGQNVSKTGTTAANFLDISIGATAVGMGGAFVSVADDASAIFWNAGGIANLEKSEIILNRMDWIADTKFDYAALTINLGDIGNLGLSFTSLSMDDMKVRTVEKPEGTGEFFSAQDIAIGVSYAKKLTDRFSIGFTGKYIQQKIWHMSASAFALDIGTLFRTDLLGGMMIGASLSNFGTPMTLDGRDTRYFIRVDDTKLGSNERIPTNIEMDSWDLPLRFRIGVSTAIFNFDNYSLLISADAVHPNNDYQSMNFGAEFSFLDFLFIRGGYQDVFLKDSEGGLSFGVGVSSKMLFTDTFAIFDYAYRDFGRLSNIHLYSISIQF
jgi:hypothetical protein